MSRRFEITIPGPGDGDMLMKLSIEADNWLDALRMGLKELGNERLPDDAVCDIQPNGVIRVRDPASGRTFVVRKLGANGAATRRVRIKSAPPERGPQDETRPAPNRAGKTTANRPAVNAAPSRRARVRPGAKLQRVGADEHPTEPQLEAPVEDEDVATPPRGGPAIGGDEAPKPQRRTSAQRRRRLQEMPTTALPAAAGRALADDQAAPRPDRRKRETDVITIVCEAVPELENPVLTAEQIIDSSVDLAREHIPCAAAQFLLPGPTPNRYRVVAARGGEAGGLVRTWLTLEDWLADLVAHRPATVRLVDLELTFQYEKSRGRRLAYDVDSVLWVPIRRRGRLLAVLLMLNSPCEDGFSDGEVNALDYLAMTLAKALVKHL